jgi:arylformamidase
MPLTADAVEKGYNNRAAVPDFQRWVVQWMERSAQARAALAPVLDLRYGPGPKETLDLFLPAGAPRGTLLFLHGGYWYSRDKSEHSFIAPLFVEHGYAVAVANYDLCPQVRVADIVGEAQRAVAWIAREGARYGANPANIVVAGHSAGGHLVAMLYATDWQALGFAAAPFAAGITLSGVHDLRPLPLVSFNADMRLDDAQATQLSPVLLQPRVVAPMLVAVGADETSEFVRQAQSMWDAWLATRPEGSTGPLVIPARNHFNVVLDMAAAGTDLSAATLALLGGERG